MGDQSEHSLLSASAAPRWTRCYGSIALESTQPNNGSKYAAEGTAAHALAAWLLGGSPKEMPAAHYGVCKPDTETSAAHFIGHVLTADGQDFELDAEFADHVQRYVDYVKSLGGVLLVETKVNYARFLGVPRELAWGTSDAIAIYLEPELIWVDAEGRRHSEEGGNEVEGAQLGRLIASVVDLKFGAGVAVYPNNNEQALLYAGGSLSEIEMVVEVLDTDLIQVVIHQPRIGEGEPSEWFVSVGALRKWLKVEAAMAAQHAVKLYDAVNHAMEDGDFADHEIAAQTVTANELTPGDKQCRFCRAKAVCPALTQMVVDTVAHGFVDLDAMTSPLAETLSEKSVPTAQLSHRELGDKMLAIPLIEATIKSWQERTKALLLASETVGSSEGDLWLKKGKQGDRKWADEEKAAKVLQRNFGAAEAFQRKVISPTAAEKLVKREKPTKQDQERVMATLNKYITRSEGGYTIALPGEKGEKYVPAEATQAAFQPIAEGEAGDLSHLA